MLVEYFDSVRKHTPFELRKSQLHKSCVFYYSSTNRNFYCETKLNHNISTIVYSRCRSINIDTLYEILKSLQVVGETTLRCGRNNCVRNDFLANQLFGGPKRELFCGKFKLSHVNLIGQLIKLFNYIDL